MKLLKYSFVLSVFSVFMFAILQKNPSGVLKLEGSDLFSWALKAVPFYIFYALLYLCILWQFSFYFKDRLSKKICIDNDSSQCFLTYQRRYEFEKDFPHEGVKFYEKIKNCKIRNYFIKIIVNNDRHLIEDKEKILQEIDDCISREIGKVIDKYYFIFYYSELYITTFMHSGVMFFASYLVIALPFIYLPFKPDIFLVKISLFSDAKLFVHGLNVDTHIFMSPLLAGLIFGCLSTTIPLIFSLFYKKKHLDFLYDIKSQIDLIKNQISSAS